MAGGVPLITHPQQVCQDCLAGKQSRFSFPASTNYRASKPLELIHADLCGPISPATIGGSHFFMLLVDDFSRWMWIYVIKTKDQALLMFDKFKRLVENSQNRRIKILRTDRGGEFLSTNFTRLCEDAGIDRQFTAPYTPQQNGVVERRNRTVMGMARSLLKSMSVPREFWGEAVRHSVYLLNQLPTKALGSRTPFEVWHGKKPHLGHLRVFGCKGHVKVITPNLKKLDDRSIPMVYLGVEDGSKAHRLFNPHKGAIQVSRDVIFEENKKWNWNLDDGRSSGFEVEEPKTQAVSRMPIVAIDTFNNAIGGGSSNSATPTMASTMTSISPSRVVTETVEEEDLNEGPIRYRNIVDILRDAPRMDREEEIEEEALLIEEDEPTCYREVAGQAAWEQAMKIEIEAIEKNETWSLTELPVGHKVIGLKWVFKLKKNSNGEIIKYKARLVAKGYTQQQGVDFDEVFAPVARLDTVRVILAVAANRGWRVDHLDVKSAFLNGELQEEVYVAQPEGYVVQGKESFVYKLHKALYGLRQAPRAWNTCLDKSLKNLGFMKCTQEQAVYIRGEIGANIIIGVYVDDLIVTGEDAETIADFKKKMFGEFDMSDLGMLHYYLGIEVAQEKGEITIK